MAKFNNQFATQKLRQETSVTGTGAGMTPSTVNNPVTQDWYTTKNKKKAKKEVKDVEPKLAAGKAKIYMKDKWGWKDAPSIPNRPSKGGFIYKQLFEELSNAISEGNVPENIAKFAKRKGATSIVNTIAKWTEKAGKKITGGTAIGKNYDTLIIDLGYQDSAIYVDLDDKTIKVYDQPVKSYNDFISALESKDIPEPEEQDDDEDSYDWFTNSNINESYSKFKTETKTRGKSDQFHQAVREVRRKVQEINRLFEYVSRLKSELSEGEGGLKYKMHTEKALAKIKEMVSELNQNIKKFK
jgi:hypothetical protein